MTRHLYTHDADIIRRLREYFELQCIASMGTKFHPNACASLIPSDEQLAEILDATFWASLRNEEGRAVIISLAFVDSASTEDPFLFGKPLPLDPESLAKIAPAVERPGIHLGVAVGADDQLEVWGYTRRVPLSAMVLEVAGPGLLIVKHRRKDARGKFANIAVMTGNRAAFIQSGGPTYNDFVDFLRNHLGKQGTVEDLETVSEALQRIALSMRAHRRGGTLLVVPASSDSWAQSLADPIAYRAASPYTELREAARKYQEGGGARKLANVVEAVGGLTAVDGATIVTDRLEVIGFGAKIRRREGATPVADVLMLELAGAAGSIPVPIWALGGTRHQSAAQFVQDQPGAIALVSSQEGRFTLFSWSAEFGQVVANRVEAWLY